MVRFSRGKLPPIPSQRLGTGRHSRRGELARREQMSGASELELTLLCAGVTTHFAPPVQSDMRFIVTVYPRESTIVDG